MSKEAALRAMREARYAERMARAAGSAAGGQTAPVRPRAPAARTTQAAPARVEPPGSPASTDALCGHRSMNGRTCTRELGHTAKNHRYS